MQTDPATNLALTISETTRQQIATLLSELESKHNLRVLFACESGSRAWGFASNDSDFDVRFLFVRPATDYLRLRPPVDAFDVMAPGDIDAAGWDIRKTAELMRRSNPPLMEWIDSSIIYQSVPDMHDRLRTLRSIYFDAKKAAFHYLSMATNVWESYLQNNERPIRKKYLYVLRPLACISYIASHKQQPPTAFDAVLGAIRWPEEVMEQVWQLIADKQRNTELGAGHANEILNHHIEKALQEGEMIANDLTPNEQPTEPLDRFISEIVLAS